MKTTISKALTSQVASSLYSAYKRRLSREYNIVYPSSPIWQPIDNSDILMALEDLPSIKNPFSSTHTLTEDSYSSESSEAESEEKADLVSRSVSLEYSCDSSFIE